MPRYRLASHTSADRVNRSSLDVLLFELAGSSYALQIAQVVEIVRAVAVAPLPEAPVVVDGVLNLRGRIVPVVDLRRRFGHPGTPVHPDEHFIVARAGERIVVFRADPSTRVARAAADSIERASRVVAGAELVAGMVRLPDGVALLQDVEGFLTQAEAASLDHALRAADLRTGDRA